MSECCSKPAPADTHHVTACGVCLMSGARVASSTVKALLTEVALRRFEPADYRLCSSAGCDVTYYADRGPTFSTRDVRARPWRKEPRGARTVCYCFGENEADIADEFERTGSSRAVERVRAHIRAGRCACEVRNPSGACCLGDVSAAVERMRQQISKERQP
jgi:hypothetical protein